MARPLLAAALALALACSLDPGGRCTTDAQCSAGLQCSSGVCVVRAAGADLGASCLVDSDCVAWATCEQSVCMLSLGACVTSAECPPWRTCTNHACVDVPGKCGSSADCAAWQTCDLTRYACVTAPGSCTIASAQAECGPFRTCQTDHTCASSDGTDVLLWGTLTAGDACTGAVALLGDPTTPVVGLGCAWKDARLDARGAVVYREVPAGATSEALLKLVPDMLIWNGTSWVYPASADANDVRIATPNCKAGVIQRWTIQAGTGEVFHSCDPDRWFDASNAVRFTEPAGADLVAWNAGDAKLVVATGAYSVVDAVNVAHPVTGLPAGQVWTARAHADGFWMALADTASGADELWAIAATGAATLSGAYPPLPVGLLGVNTLDEAGAAYTFAGTKIVKRVPGGPAAAVVYDSTGHASNWAVSPAQWYVQAAGQGIVAGP